MMSGSVQPAVLLAAQQRPKEHFTGSDYSQRVSRRAAPRVFRTVMYEDHFRLRGMPFSTSPDPHYFYLSNPHRDALTHLLHAVKGQGGVVLLTGEIGAGKTTVCRRMLTDLPGDVDVALIYNPLLTPRELLEALCEEFHVDAGSSLAESELFDGLRESLLAAQAAGRTALLVIDEAQGLRSEALQTLTRLLDHLQGDGRHALRLALIGQPELNELLEHPWNAHFDAHVVARHHLGALSASDVPGYVMHRLSIAGGNKQLFPHRLMRRLHRMSGGIPRIINLICDRALLGAYVQGRRAVNGRTLHEAWSEVTGQDSLRRRWKHLMLAAASVCGLMAASACLAMLMHTDAPQLTRQMPPASDVSTADLNPLDPSDWPDGFGGQRSEALAFEAVLKHWNTVPANAVPCSTGWAGGLQCVQGRDSLEEMRRLGTPAVLQLMDRQGHQMHVALVQLVRDQAILQLGETTRSVPLAALESQWTRRYTVMWRPPPLLEGAIEPGSGGPQALWLRERVARLKGVAAEALPARLEGALKAQLREFQTIEGLPPSGAGDLRTLVHLASKTEPGAPSLEAARCPR